MRPVSKSYRSTNHQVLGSDILSIVDVLPLPEQLLGKERAQALREVKPGEWYPISMMLEPLDAVAAKMGDRALIPIGYALIKRSHSEAIRKHFKSAKELLSGFDGLYRRANRGDEIGGWKVLSFEPGKALLENTIPHHCFIQVGIVQEALKVLQIPAVVKQTQCVREGADACHFLVTTTQSDARWLGR